MSVTPTWDIPLPADGQSPWGADYREAMIEIDRRLGGMRGSLYVEDNATETVITTAGVAVAAALGNVQSGPPCRFCDVNQVGQITYVGPLDRVPTVQASVTLQSTGGNKTARVEVRVNGTAIAGSAKRVRFGPNVTVASVAVFANVQVETDDELQVFVANLTDTSNLTVLDLTLAVRD